MSYNPFKEKLLTFNSLDPTINAKKKDGELLDLKNYINNQDLYEFVWTSKDELVISMGDLVKAKETIAELKTPAEFIEFCEKNKFQLTQFQISSLSKNFNVNKKKISDDLLKKLLSNSEIFRNFQTLADQIQNDENVYTLYIASYFLNGNDINGQPINSPLLLWDVNIKIENNDVIIRKLSENPTINEKLMFYLKNTYKVKYTNYKTIADIQKYPELLRKIVSFSFPKETKFNHFIPHKNGNFFVSDSCCLAILEPLGGAIKKDVDMIINKEKSLPIKSNNNLANYQIYKNKVLENDNLIETRPLNIYQKYAVTSALENDTLIFGPPGTGKSETITTIINNVVYRNKNVLISSEKQAALDVLQERLGKVSTLALFAFKPSYTDEFYNSLIKISNAISSSNDYDNKEFEKKRINIQNKYQELKDQNLRIFKVQDELKDHLDINELFKIYNRITQEEILKYDPEFFYNLKTYFNLKKVPIIDSYELVKEIQKLINNKNNTINFLQKHSLKITKEQTLEFLQHFELKESPVWMLNQFIKGKKNWSKEPLIKRKIKHQVSIIKIFEQFVKSNINEIDFSKVSIIASMPSFINDEDDYKKYIVFSLLRDVSSSQYYSQNSIDVLIKKYRQTKINESLKNDEYIFNKYITHLKTLMEHDVDLAIDIKKIFSKAYVSAKKRPSINKLIKEHYKTLRALFPIWILSPSQNCVLNPLKQNLFDYGIFDEASQMFLENAIPLLYRTKIAIVAGDDKQLQPSAFFMKKVDDTEEDGEITESLGTSLLDQATINLWPKFNLKNHYRSARSELIQFSSETFYNKELEYNNKNIAPTKLFEQPIVVYEAHGVWKDRKNEKEIEKILELIPKYKDQDLLIITFNQAQADELLKRFANQFSGSQIFEHYQENKIKIKSLENVQGEEADVVILSIAYAKDSFGKVRQAFGPLSQQNGCYRLNVAITRAKKQLVVIKSISSNDVVYSQTNENNNIFKAFLKFVETNDHNKLFVPIEKELNDLQKEIIENLKLNEKRFDVIPNVKIGKDVIDIAIVDKHSNLIKLSLKLKPFNSTDNLEDIMTDIDNQLFLEDLGYKTLRIMEIEWKQNKNFILKQIQKLLN